MVRLVHDQPVRPARARPQSLEQGQKAREEARAVRQRIRASLANGAGTTATQDQPAVEEHSPSGNGYVDEAGGNAETQDPEQLEGDTPPRPPEADRGPTP